MATCAAIAQRRRQLPSAPSNVNELRSVPTTVLIEMMTAFAAPVPAGCRHMSEVVVTQLSVVHGVAPIDMDAVESVEPKFDPHSVCVEPPVVGPFAAIKDVTIGGTVTAQGRTSPLVTSDPAVPVILDYRFNAEGASRSRQRNRCNFMHARTKVARPRYR